MSEKKEFPVLYKKTSKGEIERWEICAEDGSPAFFVSTHGLLGKKQVSKRKDVPEGKNIGKKNETTPFQQACKEAESKWKKKVKKGYFESEEDARGKVVLLPMLAHDYQKRSHDIVWPAFAQAKIDGVRCLGLPDGTLLSRGGDPFPTLDHIRLELAHLQEKIGETCHVDGELWTPNLSFQVQAGLVRKAKDIPPERMEQLEMVHLHVFDCFDPKKPDWTFEERYNFIALAVESGEYETIELVPVCEVADEEALRVTHDDYVKAGYEGIIVRNKEGLYKLAHRSPDLQKFKVFFDDEFEIVGYKPAQETVKDIIDVDGRPKTIDRQVETVVWKCITKSGDEFEVRPVGTWQQRQKWLQCADEYIQKLLTVKYQELTDEGIPRFPVGKAIREDGI